MSLLDQTASLIANRSLQLKPNETVLLITDTQLDPSIRESLARGLAATGATVRDVVVSFDEGNVAMELPDPSVVEGVDAVVAPVSRSLTYNRDIAKVKQRGGRVLSMPRIIPEALERVATSDFDGMIAASRQVAEQFAGNPSTLELRSPAGTHLTLDIKDCHVQVTDGVVGPGENDQLPAGVVSVVGRNARGTVVINGPITLVEKMDEPIRLQIENHTIVGISGGKAAKQLETILDSYEERDAVRHCPAEIGIGTNPSVVYDPDGPFYPEFARALGILHVGIGDDHLFEDGTVVAPIHADFMLPDTEVWLDGKKLEISKG